MRKVVKEGEDWVSLSCPYLFITYNNPFYLTSLLSVGTGSPVRGPSGLGPGVKLLHGSTCYNFPPLCWVCCYFIWAHVCQLFVGSAANTDNVSVCSLCCDRWNMVEDFTSRFQVTISLLQVSKQHRIRLWVFCFTLDEIFVFAEFSWI